MRHELHREASKKKKVGVKKTKKKEHAGCLAEHEEKVCK